MENDAIIKYCQNNTGLEVSDVFKFLYQSCFGCEHLISDSAAVVEKIYEEMPYADLDDLPDVEMLDGDFCRVHIKAVKGDDGLKQLAELFVISAEKQPDGPERLKKCLKDLINNAKDGLIPFSEDEIIKAVSVWHSQGFCPVHHSETFRKLHHPAYRVIKKEFLEKLT